MLSMLNFPLGVLGPSLISWLVKSLLRADHGFKVRRRPGDVPTFSPKSKPAEQMSQWPPEFIALAHQRYSALRYLWCGPSEIEAQYTKAEGAAFTVATPGNLHICVSSEQQISELERAPENYFSLHAIAKDMFQPKYTMNGYELKEEPTANSQGFARVLRTLLTSKLPLLHSAIQSRVSEAFTQELSNHEDLTGWSSIRTSSLAKTVVTKANSCVFFGDDIANDSEFLAAAQRYPQDVFMTGEILRFTPSALAPTIAHLCTDGHSASRRLVGHLTSKVQSRLETRGQDRKKPLDCVQWIIDSSPHKDAWTSKRIIQEILALWFGSVHQLAMSFTYALYDLCDHPEYIAPSREEIERAGLEDFSAWQPENMPRLDSFLKESARLNPSDAISIRRKVLAPYTFSDGTHFAEGSWACIPQRCLMRDNNIYPSAKCFQGFRFVASAGSGCTSSLTDTSPKFPFWGAGKRVCPGRFYASATLKIMVAHVLLNFDCKLLSAEAPRSFSWRSAIIPRSSTILQMRRRSSTL